jgi:F-type H+-transporting ATPase subunit b
VNTSSSKAASAVPAAGADEPRRYPHDAPERDFVNFPPFKTPEEPGKLRIGFIPEEWFKAMESKTGVMGPYVTFWAGLATIFSKEIYIVWADMAEHVTFFAVLIYASKKFGPKIADFLDKEAVVLNKKYETDLQDKTIEVDGKIQASQALASLPEANQLVNAAKRVWLLNIT